MSVRHATAQDMDRLLELVQVMHAEAVALNHAPLALEKVELAFSACMRSGVLIVHVDGEGVVDGFFAGIVDERWFSRARCFFDLGFFVHPDRRGGLAAYRILRMLIDWLKQKGIRGRDVVLGVSTGVHPESTGKFFEQLGFVRLGGMYTLGED